MNIFKRKNQRCTSLDNSECGLVKELSYCKKRINELYNIKLKSPRFVGGLWGNKIEDIVMSHRGSDEQLKDKVNIFVDYIIEERNLEKRKEEIEKILHI